MKYFFLVFLLGAIVSIGLSSCEQDDIFENIEGSWYNSDMGYICFRDDGTGYFQGQEFGYGGELHVPDNFVYEYALWDTLVYLRFEDDGFKDTLRLSPKGANEVQIDDVDYLRVKHESLLQFDSIYWYYARSSNVQYWKYDWISYSDGIPVWELQFDGWEEVLLKDKISGDVEYYREDYWYGNDDELEGIVFKLSSGEYRNNLVVMDITSNRMIVELNVYRYGRYHTYRRIFRKG